MKSKINLIIVAILLTFVIPLGVLNEHALADGGNPGTCKYKWPADPCRYIWSSISKTPIAGYSYSEPATTCVSGSNLTSEPLTLMCTYTTGTQVTWTISATVGGNWPAGFANISAMVQYSVTQSSSLAPGGSMVVPPHKSGWLTIQAIYDDRYKVKQQREKCEYGGGHIVKPLAVACQWQKVYAYAITEKYEGTHYVAHPGTQPQ